MKKLNLIVGILAAMLVSFSCESDLEQSPISSLSADTYFQTEADIEAAVAGVYASLQARGLYEEYLAAIGEEPSDNTFSEVPANDGGIFGELDEFTRRPGNALISEIWTASYLSIQRANTVLSRIEDIIYDSESIKAQRIGEMQFIRALLYFNLVRIYGDVPLVVEETTDPNTYFGQGRTSVDAVYERIENDLLGAIGDLSNGHTDGRVTKTAAQALLGKVYLTLGSHSLARTQLLDVVNSGEHQLLTAMDQIFAVENEYNQEIIFAVKFGEGLDGNSEGSSAHVRFSPSTVVSGGKGQNIPTRELYNAYDPEDARLSFFVAITPSGVPYSLKFKPAAGDPDDGPSDMVVLRYADVILMLAECENSLNNQSEAAAYLNQIRNRAGLSNTSAATQAELSEAIAMERRYELIGEGHRWFDLLRTGTAIQVMNDWFTAEGINIEIDKDDLLMPIPESQIDTDTAIKQNDGY